MSAGHRIEPWALTVTEMAPNSVDHFGAARLSDNLPRAERDTHAPFTYASALLDTYLAVVRALEQRCASIAVGDTTGVAAQQHTIDGDTSWMLEQIPADLSLGQSLIGLHLDQQCARLLIQVKPRWRETIVLRVLTAAAKQYHHTGRHPDHRHWFAGAQVFVSLMVPPEHHAATLALLDYDALLAAARRLDGSGELPAFDPTRLTISGWVVVAMRAHPVAAIHAALALAAWVFAQPGESATIRSDPRRAISRAAGKVADLGNELTGHDLDTLPISAPEPPFYAGWQVRWDAYPDRYRRPLPQPGDPITTWSAAYQWASMLTTWSQAPRDVDLVAVPDPGDTPARVLLAAAIGNKANWAGLTELGITGAHALGPVSMPLLMMTNLHPLWCVTIIDRVDKGLRDRFDDEEPVSIPDHDCRPCPGEPGEDIYRELVALTATSDGDHRIRGHAREAYNAVAIATWRAVADPDDLPDDIPLSSLGSQLDRYLSRSTTTT